MKTINVVVTLLLLTGCLFLGGCLDESERICVQNTISALERQPENAERVACLQSLLTTSEETDRLIAWLLGLAGVSGVTTLATVKKAIKYRSFVFEIVRAFNAAKVANTADLYKIDKSKMRSSMSEGAKVYVESVREKIVTPGE